MFGLGVTDAPIWSSLFSASSYAGKAVNMETTLPLAGNLACIRVNSQACASMPLQMFRKEANGSRVPIDHALSDIINGSPNSDQTSLEFWEAMTAWLLARGNAYAEIERSGNRIVALNLLPAEKVQPFRDTNGDLTYRFNDRGQQVDIPAESVLHIKGFGFGGDLGLDPIRYGAQVYGSSIAAEETSGKLLGSGLTPSGILTASVDLTDPQKVQLREMLEKFSGSNNAGKVLTLPQGLTYTPISIDPEAMQLLETRRFNVEMVCVFHGVPPAIIGFAAENVTQWGTGIEALQLQWLSTGLNPILNRIERRIRKQLLGPGDRGVYCEFNRESLLQMDSTAKAGFISSGVQNGWMTRAEARQKLNFPRIEGADQLTAQTNLAPLDKLGAAVDPRATMRGALGIEDVEQ